MIKNLNIIKFGGSSVSDNVKIKNVSNIIFNKLNKTKSLIVVFSAFGGVTNNLINLSLKAAKGDTSYLQDFQKLYNFHKSTLNSLLEKDFEEEFKYISMKLNNLKEVLHGVFLIKEFSPKTRDFVLSFGERLSNRIIYLYLKNHKRLNTNIQYIDSREFIKTDNNFGNARVNFKQTEKKLTKYFKNNSGLFVFTGFIGSTNSMETTTLGRGGSDFTASILASLLNSENVELWSDVDGFMSADPRKVENVLKIEGLTYEEAIELSHFGAKIVYPPAIQPVLDKNIPIFLKNTFNEKDKGTKISESPISSKYLITGISSIENIDLFRIEGSGMIGLSGIEGRLFGTLAKRKINIIMITQGSSEHSICFAVNPNDSTTVKEMLEEELKLEIKAHEIEKIKYERNLSIIAIVGENMRKRIGVSGKLFTAIANAGVNVIATAQGSSELNITIVVNSKNEKKALNAIHNTFFNCVNKKSNLYIAGHTGLIGKELISIIEENNKNNLEKGLDSLQISGTINSKEMNFTNNLEVNTTKKVDFDKFINLIIKENVKNKVFVDCTASSLVSEYYEKLLLNGVSVVTPNKIANSGKFQYYKNLKKAKLKGNSKFLYETNVGAGLPVIKTLKELIDTGDSVLKIEAILSGTLSYIFNTFKENLKFSEVVKKAKEKGFTEPNPENDLTGMDVARKLLILTRECGESFEIEDLSVENLVPKSARNSDSCEEFFNNLEKFDNEFENLKNKAEQKGEKLRYIATFENGKGVVKLQSVSKEHPFFNMEGSDNIVSFYTKRYKNPLVIKGAGAGASVTAAGVYSDILKVLEN